MARVLVLFAHPALEQSRVHRRLIGAAAAVSGVTIRDLYELYPDLDVDVAAEQAAMEAHDVIIFQHPIYWYSAPALVRQWQDLVLEHGWAFGHEGLALQGKATFHVVSSGGRAEAYRASGSNRFTIHEFLRPFEQTAHLCNMTWWSPFVVYGTHRLGDEVLADDVAGYRALLEGLVADRLDPARLADLSNLRELVA
ncbi:MAG: NAD(P)H-dependent oxidoreductase [Myxococcota bacterium]